MEQAYHGPTLARWRTQMKSASFQGLRKLQLLHTDSSHFLAVLRHPRAGTSSQKWLRILHNRAMDLGWILAPVMARRIWPKIRTRENQSDHGGAAPAFGRDGTGCRIQKLPEDALGRSAVPRPTRHVPASGQRRFVQSPDHLQS